MINKNDLIELDITAISPEGSGIGKYSDGELENFVVYVPFTAIGDRIKCRVLKKLSSYAFGKVEELITPSSDRCENTCKAFGKCGGCTYRHIKYEAELAYKKEAVKSAYRYAFGNEEITVNATVGSDKIASYRNKVEFPIDENGRCSFYSQRSHRHTDISGCDLQDKRLAKVVQAFEEYVKDSKASPYDEQTGKGLLRHLYLRTGTESGEICVCVVANAEKLPKEEILSRQIMSIEGVKSLWINVNREKTNVILGNKYRLISGEKYIKDEMCGITMQISPQSFYQVNKHQAEKIYEFAIKQAGIGRENRVLDLYCGIGGITMAAAKYAGEAVGVEIVPEAIADARRIANENKIDNVRFYVSDANRLENVLRDASFKPDTVIIDPPRKGIDRETSEAILRIAPKTLVYISCNPQTQARNVKDFRDAAEASGIHYKISAITPFDMFPRTAHVETVCLLTREAYEN